MKRPGLVLLASLLPGGVAGCIDSSADRLLYAYLPGTCHLTRMSASDAGVLNTSWPPDVAGTLRLTNDRTYQRRISYRGQTSESSGSSTASTKYGVFAISLVETGTGAGSYGTVDNEGEDKYRTSITELRDESERFTVFVED